MSTRGTWTLRDIAEHLGAQFDGPPALESVEIDSVAGLEAARVGQIAFLANPKYTAAAQKTSASAVLVPPDFSGLPTSKTAALRIRNPYLAFARAIELFYSPPAYPTGIHPTAVVARSAQIGAEAHIGPFVCIGENVSIGNNARILAHVVVYEGCTIGDNFFAHAHSVVREHCRIGNNVVLQNGVVLGGDGFGFAKDDQGRWYKILQSGTVTIADDVEVQSNACIDRASIGQTSIGADTKIDNLVQVGHGSSVAEHTMLCAQVGLAGSTEVGSNVILAGQVGVAGHCRIGDGVVATAQSGIPNDVKAGKMVSGYPAIDNRAWLRSVAVFNKLPELAKTVRHRLGRKNEDE